MEWLDELSNVGGHYLSSHPGRTEGWVGGVGGWVGGWGIGGRVIGAWKDGKLRAGYETQGVEVEIVGALPQPAHTRP